MDAAFVQGIWTALAFIIFVAIVVWAYSPKRHKDFEAAARLALDDDDLDQNSLRETKDHG